MTFQVKRTTTGKLRYRAVLSSADENGVRLVPLTRWCGSLEGARKAHKKATVPK